MLMKNIIITGDLEMRPAGRPWPGCTLNLAYANAIAAAGALPIMMTTTQLAADYAELADGLLITGGESVHPRYYNETFTQMADGDPVEIRRMRDGCNSARDEMEMAAFSEFFKRKKPILGICRGHQLLNAAMGGQNMLNFPRHHKVEHHMGVQHPVNAEPGSVLEKLYGGQFLVNSFHCDCAVKPGEDVRVTAYSDDGIIEAIEHKTLPVFGVQFHPERMRGDNPNPAFGPDGTKLFQYFVDLC